MGIRLLNPLCKEVKMAFSPNSYCTKKEVEKELQRLATTGNYEGPKGNRRLKEVSFLNFRKCLSSEVSGRVVLYFLLALVLHFFLDVLWRECPRSVLGSYVDFLFCFLFWLILLWFFYLSAFSRLLNDILSSLVFFPSFLLKFLFL